MTEFSSRNILFSSVDAPPKRGGVSVLAEQLTNDLSNFSDIESTFVGPSGSQLVSGAPNVSFYVDHQSNPKLRSGEGALQEFARIEDLFLRIARFKKLTNIIVWHPFYYGPPAVSAAKKLGIPCSIFVHGTELTSQFPESTSRDKAIERVSRDNSLPFFLQDTLCRCEYVFANSRFTAEIVRRISNRNDVHVVGAGISEDLIQENIELLPGYSQEEKSTFRERLGLPNRKTISCLGRMVPHKNQVKAVEIVSEVDNAQLLLIGDGPERSNLEAFAEELGVSDRVFFTGEVSEEIKWNLLRASDAGMLLSKYSPKTGGYEGFGIALLEYAVAGCLPIGAREAGVQELVDIEGIGVGVDQNLTGEDVSKMLHDEAGINTIVQASRAKIQSSFTWPKIAEKIARVLDLSVL